MCRSLSFVAPTMSWVLWPAGAKRGACLYLVSSCRQLDVHAQPVGQKAELLNKLRRRAGDGLGVDIAVEAVFVAQKRERTDHQLRCVIRRAQHAGGEEEAFDIVSPVEFDRQLR